MEVAITEIRRHSESCLDGELIENAIVAADNDHVTDNAICFNEQVQVNVKCDDCHKTISAQQIIQHASICPGGNSGIVETRSTARLPRHSAASPTSYSSDPETIPLPSHTGHSESGSTAVVSQQAGHLDLANMGDPVLSQQPEQLSFVPVEASSPGISQHNGDLHLVNMELGSTAVVSQQAGHLDLANMGDAVVSQQPEELSFVPVEDAVVSQQPEQLSFVPVEASSPEISQQTGDLHLVNMELDAVVSQQPEELSFVPVEGSNPWVSQQAGDLRLVSIKGSDAGVSQQAGDLYLVNLGGVITTLDETFWQKCLMSNFNEELMSQSGISDNWSIVCQEGSSGGISQEHVELLSNDVQAMIDKNCKYKPSTSAVDQTPVSELFPELHPFDFNSGDLETPTLGPEVQIHCASEDSNFPFAEGTSSTAPGPINLNYSTSEDSSSSFSERTNTITSGLVNLDYTMSEGTNSATPGQLNLHQYTTSEDSNFLFAEGTSSTAPGQINLNYSTSEDSSSSFSERTNSITSGLVNLDYTMSEDSSEITDNRARESRSRSGSPRDRSRPHSPDSGCSNECFINKSN